MLYNCVAGGHFGDIGNILDFGHIGNYTADREKTFHKHKISIQRNFPDNNIQLFSQKYPSYLTEISNLSDRNIRLI